MNYLTEPLSSAHEREVFSCGNELLDNYIRFQAKQDIKRKLSACFVLAVRGTNNISGYYTLCGCSIPSEQIPDSFRKRLPPSYTSIPAILLGRLAIARQHHGKGIGKLLLTDALKRSYDISGSLGSFAVVVDPIDPEAEHFYAKYGFINLPDSGKMFLPMKTIRELFTTNGNTSAD